MERGDRLLNPLLARASKKQQHTLSIHYLFRLPLSFYFILLYLFFFPSCASPIVVVVVVYLFIWLDSTARCCCWCAPSCLLTLPSVYSRASRFSWFSQFRNRYRIGSSFMYRAQRTASGSWFDQDIIKWNWCVCVLPRYGIRLLTRPSLQLLLRQRPLIILGGLISLRPIGLVWFIFHSE